MRALVVLASFLAACGGEATSAPPTTAATIEIVASNRPSDPWPSGTTRSFRARWSRTGSGWIYDGNFVLRNDGGRVSGQILWTLVAVDMVEGADLSPRVGDSGTEYVVGTYAAGEHRIDLTGTGVSDDTLIGADTYQLTLTDDGRIVGRTLTQQANWSGTLSPL